MYYHWNERLGKVDIFQKYFKFHKEILHRSKCKLNGEKAPDLT